MAFGPLEKQYNTLPPRGSAPSAAFFAALAGRSLEPAAAAEVVTVEVPERKERMPGFRPRGNTSRVIGECERARDTACINKKLNDGGKQIQDDSPPQTFIRCRNQSEEARILESPAPRSASSDHGARVPKDGVLRAGNLG
ncbi:hypothetical protein KM043_010176 [Ampulex compressa]|nr:hypothetical protein KM043_010176 [Ampulex compressa]